jgi:hypothetical protein
MHTSLPRSFLAYPSRLQRSHGPRLDLIHALRISLASSPTRAVSSPVPNPLEKTINSYKIPLPPSEQRPSRPATRAGKKNGMSEVRDIESSRTRRTCALQTRAMSHSTRPHQSRSITSKSSQRAILANAAKPAYNLFKQNPGQCLRELRATDLRAADHTLASHTPNEIYKVKLARKSPMQQSLRTLRPELSNLRTLGGINQQQCPYRGSRPRLNVTQILPGRLRLEANSRWGQ